MVDKGAALNLIKQDKLKTGIQIDKTNLLRLIGITDGQVDTLESVKTNVLEHAVMFHVVPKDFPMGIHQQQDGILGSEFPPRHGKNKLCR